MARRDAADVRLLKLGGLMAYGLHFPSMFTRGASYVARILAGAKASELPIERPSKFELVINLKTATQVFPARPFPAIATVHRPALTVTLVAMPGVGGIKSFRPTVRIAQCRLTRIFQQRSDRKRGRRSHSVSLSGRLIGCATRNFCHWRLA